MNEWRICSNYLGLKIHSCILLKQEQHLDKITRTESALCCESLNIFIFKIIKTIPKVYLMQLLRLFLLILIAKPDWRCTRYQCVQSDQCVQNVQNIQSVNNCKMSVKTIPKITRQINYL